MSQKKNNRLRTILTCLFALLILVGFLWGTKAEQPAEYDFNTSFTDSLLLVEIPALTPCEILNYEGFIVSFNPNAHQPNYVAWELTAEESDANLANRKDYDFAADTDVDGCATLQDYKGSGYSRGHMIPAADAKWSPEAMRECFLLTNICPQSAKLNAGAWKSVEDKCRTWAKRDSSLIIICGPVLTDKLSQTIGATRIPVPERFFKVILAPKANPMRAIGFIMNNGYVEGGMQATAVSVDEVEKITDFDFFSALPDEIENKIEAECNFPLWSRKH